MTWKQSLPLPVLTSKAREFVEQEEDLLDVALYGSVMRGKSQAKDLDLAILLKNEVEAVRSLELAQEFKEQVKELWETVDVKTVSLQDLLDPSFIAGGGIVAEGYLLLRQEFVSSLLGLQPFIAFTYSLTNLTQSEKTMFRYALNGRRGQEGFLEQSGAKKPGKGIILVPIQHSEEFKQILDRHEVNYESHSCLWAD